MPVRLETRVPARLVEGPLAPLLTVAALALVLASAVLLLPPFMAAATFSYSCLLAGISARRRRTLHVPLMAAGMLIDLAIVLTLEIQRNAVKTALSFSLSPLQQMHIGASTIATILYFPLIFLGIRSWFGSARDRSLHRKLGTLAFLFRTLGFLLMFSLLWKPA